VSENESAAEVALPNSADAELVSRDRSLTLRPERLAGSPACLNCGTELKGPFCYYCGQPDRNFLRFFPALLREFMEDFLELDSRFVRTMKPLLFKPGRLTRDYLEGRRFRYTPPMRLYLFSSIAFFLLAAMMSTNAINIGTRINPQSGEPDLNINWNDSGTDERTREEILADVRQQLKESGVQDAEDIMEKIERGTAGVDASAAEQEGHEDFTTDQITINGKPWNRETNPFVINWLPQFVNDWINDEIEESPEKARQINENPNLIVDKIFDILPATMFVLLPVVALLFKFWYLFARRYYIEHLIFALHNHSFVFVSLILVLLLNIAGDGFAAREWNFFTSAVNWLIVAAGVWIPLYMLISLRHVYRQNWFLTMLKFGVIGVSYVTLLSLVTSVVAVLGFVLL
jgi:hypothetical protein